MTTLKEKGTKRIASYVPWWCRAELHKLSKADLMEIAYDYAMRTVGEDAGEIAAYNELRTTAGILARCAERREVRLQEGGKLALEQGYPLHEVSEAGERKGGVRGRRGRIAEHGEKRPGGRSVKRTRAN